MSEFIRTISGSGWAPVNRRSMDDASLSISARGVLAWLVTRPDDHRIYLSFALSRLGVSRPTWRKIRRELETAGYLRVVKCRGAGRFKWEYHLTDVPTTATAISTIAKNSSDSNSADSNSADSKSGDIQDTDIQDTGFRETGLKEEARAPLNPIQQRLVNFLANKKGSTK